MNGHSKLKCLPCSTIRCWASQQPKSVAKLYISGSGWPKNQLWTLSYAWMWFSNFLSLFLHWFRHHQYCLFWLHFPLFSVQSQALSCISMLFWLFRDFLLCFIKLLVHSRLSYLHVKYSFSYLDDLNDWRYCAYNVHTVCIGRLQHI